MAPKATAPPPSAGPWAVVRFSVSRVSRLIEGSAAACTVVLRAPTLVEPARSQPCALSSVESYAVALSTTSRHPLAQASALLEQLLAHPVVVQAFLGDELVGEAELDLLPFASDGAHAVEARLLLRNRSASECTDGGAASPLVADACATVAVALFQQDDAAPGASLEEGLSELRLVQPDLASAGAVAALQPALAPPPDVEAVRAMAAAPCGFDVMCALLWRQGEGGWTGAVSGAGVCQEDGSIAWPRRRCALGPDAWNGLVGAVESGGVVLAEIGRYVRAASDAISDPAFGHFHACTDVTKQLVAQLGAPGATAAVLEAASWGPWQAAGREPASSALPPQPAYGAKAKPCQPTPAAGECGWRDAVVRISVELSKPCIAAWVPPPKPAKALRDIVPAGAAKPASSGKDATSDFKATVTELVQDIVRQYIAVAPGAAGAHDAAVAAECQRKLVFELNRSGKFVEFQHRLKTSVAAVAREQFDCDLQRYEDMRDMCNELYVFLNDRLHETLNDLRDGPPTEAPADTEARRAQLDRLIEELEAAGDVERAGRLHLQRVADGGSASPDAWTRYGAFCMRRGEASLAEEAFKRAVEIDASHLPALLALACVQWRIAKTTDNMVLNDAVAVAHHAVEEHPLSCTAWALLSMLYDDPQSLSDPSKERATHARNARHRAMQLAQTDGHTGEDPQADGFVELASLLASMHASGDLIGAVCRAALAAQPALAGTPEVVLSQARAAIQAEDGLTAADLCRQVIQSSGGNAALHSRTALLLGEALTLQGRPADALKALEAALHAFPTECSLNIYLALGSAYMRREDGHQHALDVFGHACTSQPCSVAWLGAGEACMRLGRLVDAELALAQATSLDPVNARTWALLALAHLLGEHHDEASAVCCLGPPEPGPDRAYLLFLLSESELASHKGPSLRPRLRQEGDLTYGMSAQALESAYANNLGRQDDSLLEEIGCIFCKQGHYHETVDVLRHLKAVSPGYNLGFAARIALAEALTALGRPLEALPELRAALECAATADQSALAAALLKDTTAFLPAPALKAEAVIA